MTRERTDRTQQGAGTDGAARDRAGKPGGRTLTEGLPVQRAPRSSTAAAHPFGPVEQAERSAARDPSADAFGLHLIGQSRPLDPSGQSRPLDPMGQSFLDPSRDADNDGRADVFKPPRSGRRAESVEPSRHAAQLADTIQSAIGDVDLIPSTLLPAYADARDALDPAGLQALAADILTKYQAALDVRDQVRAIVDANDPGHAAHELLPATPERDADRVSLLPRSGALEAALAIAESRLATELGPVRFRGLELAAVAPVRIARHAHITIPRLLREAINTGELVAAVVEIRALVPGAQAATTGEASAPIDVDAARAIGDRLALYASRPIHLAFLKAALGSIGVWKQIEHVIGSDGQSVGQLYEAATAQAARFGPGADLGAYKPDQIIGLLKPRQTGPGETTYSVNGSNAGQIIEAVAAIEDDEGRAAALRDLDRHGLLDTIASLAAPAKLARLHDSLPPGTGSKHVKTILRPHFEGRDTEDNSLGTLLDDVPGVGGVLHGATNIATFGFLDDHDASYRAMRSGEITEAEFHRRTGKALLKAGVIGAASYATGGAAGAYAEGLTGALAARGVVGRIASNTITGAAAGSAGAIGGRLGADAVDGRLSSGGEYAHDALMGGAIGGGLGGGLTTVGAAASKFLPESVKTPLHRLAERFPSFADDSEVFAAFQRLGAQHSEGVVVFTIGSRRLLQLAADGAVTLSAAAWRNVRQFMADTRALGTAATSKVAQLADDVGDGFGPQLVGAGGYGDVRLSVTAQATRPLHVPGPLDGPAVTVIQAERLADDLVSRAGDDAGSLFDDYGHGATYADDASEWRVFDGDEVSDLPRGLQDDRVTVVDKPSGDLDPNRPTWQESERAVSDELEWAGFTDQKSFLNGEEVSRGTPGSTRPDSYSESFRLSVDVKNYGIQTPEGRTRLVDNVIEQMQTRAVHLPKGTRQGVIVDARGQRFRPEVLDKLRARLVRAGGGLVNADDIVFLTE